MGAGASIERGSQDTPVSDKYLQVSDGQSKKSAYTMGIGNMSSLGAITIGIAASSKKDPSRKSGAGIYNTNLFKRNSAIENGKLDDPRNSIFEIRLKP